MRIRSAISLVAVLACVPIANDASALEYTETVGGDLPGSFGQPRALAFAVGSNTVRGTVGPTPNDTRDYLNFTLPHGYALTALRLLEYDDPESPTPNDGETGYHALYRGIPANVPGGAEGNPLGGWRVVPSLIGADMQSDLSTGGITSGPEFPLPLDPGTYSYVIQQTGAQRTRYGVDFIVSGPLEAPVQVPIPWFVLVGLGAAIVAIRFLSLRRP